MGIIYRDPLPVDCVLFNFSGLLELVAALVLICIDRKSLLKIDSQTPLPHNDIVHGKST